MSCEQFLLIKGRDGENHPVCFVDIAKGNLEAMIRNVQV